MKKITCKTIIWLLALLSLAACQALSNLPAFLSPGNTPQPTPQPLTGDRASQLGASALMTREQPGQSSALLIPMLAGTGEPTAGFEPINVEDYAQSGVSPSREQLAYVSRDAPDCARECLNLLNLRTWKPEFKPLQINADQNTWISNLAFNQAGTRLALAYNATDQASSSLVLVDLTSATLLKQVTLDTSVYHLGITPDGSVVLEGSRGIRPDKSMVARVMSLDGTSLVVNWQQDLEDVRLSIESSFNPLDPSAGQYLDPAVAFSPDKSRLYIAAADSINLVTVDFGSHSVSTVLIQKPMGFLERLLTAGAGVAYGKYLNGTTKSGVISADGKTMYILGQTGKAVKDQSGNWTQEMTSLGLQVVDVASGTLTGSLPTDATQLSLSVDGKTLLLNGWTNLNGASQDWTDLVDAATLKTIGHIDAQASSSRLMDGSLVYLTSHFRDGSGYAMGIYRPDLLTPISLWNEPGSGYSAWVIIP